MPRLSPDGRLALRLDAIAAQAERGVLGVFSGVAPAEIVAVWPRLSPDVRTTILDAQGASIAAVGDYLGELVDGYVPVDAAPWLGKIGEKPLDEWLAVTPRAHAARLAAGMTPTEAAVSTAGFLASKAADEPHRIGREAAAVTSSQDPRFTGWARISEPGACAFCRMLSTRGAVYRRETVDRTSQGLRYHKGCRCSIKAMPKGEGASLAKDWRNAITDDERMMRAGAMRRPEVTVPDLPTPPPQPAPKFTPDAAKRLTNADLDAELQSAWDATDDGLADLLEAEMERRAQWAKFERRSYDEYDDWRPLDPIGEPDIDLPDFEDIPQPVKTAREIRAEWEAETDIRYFDAESYGGGIRADLASEARDKGVDLWALMTGDPRVAYKYANEELLQWWSANGGRRPLWEHEAAHGRIDGAKLARKRLTEDKARALAEELIGKRRDEAMASRGAEQQRARRATSRPATEGEKLAAAQRRYQRAQKMAATP